MQNVSLDSSSDPTETWKTTLHRCFFASFYIILDFSLFYCELPVVIINCCVTSWSISHWNPLVFSITCRPWDQQHAVFWHFTHNSIIYWICLLNQHHTTFWNGSLEGAIHKFNVETGIAEWVIVPQCYISLNSPLCVIISFLSAVLSSLLYKCMNCSSFKRKWL